MRIRERTAYVQERLSLLDRTPIAWRFMARAQRAAFRTLDWPYRNHRVCHCLSTTAPRCAQPAIRRVLPVLLLMLTMLLPASKPAHTEQNPRKFGVYYGERFDPQLSAFDVLVLDADSGLDLGRIRKRAKARQLILGYLALCEVDSSRSFAWKTRQARLLLHESRYWPGSFYIDIRRPEWQRLVIDEIAPSILKAGFDGLFLDTIDDAPWLETSANSPLPGITAAAVALVQQIRLSFPNRRLMLNRGFDLLPKLERDVDMVLAESILTTSVGGERKPIRLPAESYYGRVKELQSAQARQTSLKLYSLDYWDPTDLAGIRDIYAIQRANGLEPYVSTSTLAKIIPEPAR
jgi:endo-alpha-1,4-polygalactosaminidase (GH114 family)